MTFTFPHQRGTSLGEEIDAFSKAWRTLQSGRSALSQKSRTFGNHVAREVTFGQQSGWHYHHHQLRYDEPDTFKEELVRAEWLSALDSIGRRSAGADEHAFDVGTVGTDSGARYVAKLATSVEAQSRAIGSEIASSATKGRNLATLLAQAAQGDVTARMVWLSGIADICRRKVSSVRWSRGLRAKVGMGPEKSDETVAREEVLPTDIFLGALTAMQWRGILQYRAEFALCCAANQGEDAVNNFLAGLELGQLNDDARSAVVVPLKAETCFTGWNPV